jgi:hypothetical protein
MRPHCVSDARRRPWTPLRSNNASPVVIPSSIARVQSERFAASYSAEVLAIMKAMIARPDAYEASKGEELTDIKWEQGR